MVIKNLKKAERTTDFVRRNFPDAIEKETHNGLEYRFLCPFCNGGRTSELSFDLNPETGACQCWRASCGWKSSIEWFIKHFLNVSYKRAVEIVGGGAPSNLEEVDADLQMLQKSSERSPREISMADEGVRAWVDGSVPLDQAPLRIQSDVYNWITGDRGYDYDKFVETHDLFIPPQQGMYKGRVLFKVECGEELGYLLYAYEEGVEPKTLNPSGKVLSRLIYQYDRISRGKVIFICEGIFDAARLLSYGFFATCLFGTRLSEYQKFLLSETGAEEVCVILDHGIDDPDKDYYPAKEIVRSLSSFMPEKKVSYIEINKRDFIGVPEDWKDGMDPDDLSEEQFTKYFTKRRWKITSRDEQLALQMKKLKKLRR